MLVDGDQRCPSVSDLFVLSRCHKAGGWHTSLRIAKVDMFVDTRSDRRNLAGGLRSGAPRICTAQQEGRTLSNERASERFRRKRKRRTSAALGEEEHAQSRRSWPRRVGRSGVAPAHGIGHQEFGASPTSG